MLTAGALALAVIAPVAESADRPAEAAGPSSFSVASRLEAPGFDSAVLFGPRADRASRAALRRAAAIRRAGVRPATNAVKQAVRRSVARERARIAAVRREQAARRAAAERRAEALRRSIRERRVEQAARAVEKRVVRRVRTHVATGRSVARGTLRPGMGAVISFARSQVGKAYRSGAEGPGAYDCSGFTKRAYARAGLRLPHSSGQQAARAYDVSRARALPGDLVVGPGHVGVYMGAGWMIDAGNSRTGVVYRRLYGGLRIKRF